MEDFERTLEATPEGEKLTLQSETASFLRDMPYWLQYLSISLIEESELSEEHLENASQFLLEDLGLEEMSEGPELGEGLAREENRNYYSSASLTRLEHISGGNALKENMAIDFHPNLTILFGENGSGKTSYSRLLKWTFFSRSEEDILPDVYNEEDVELEAKFYFETDEGDTDLTMPKDENASLRDQFSVFDNMAIVEHLDGRNDFEFRPAGLVFFSELNEVVNEFEEKIGELIKGLSQENPFIELFEGESEISDLIEIIDVDPDIIDELESHIPYTDEDEENLDALTKKHDDLHISLKQTGKTVARLKRTIVALNRSKQRLKELNEQFSQVALTKISKGIENLTRLEKGAKEEGIESISDHGYKELGSDEWRDFIQAAHKYAKLEDEGYPNNEDTCIFCHQELTNEARTLINKYWVYLKSEAEYRLRKAQSRIEDFKKDLNKLDFDIFPNENSLTQWLEERENKYLQDLNSSLVKQSTLPQEIINSIDERDTEISTEIQIEYSHHDEVIADLTKQIEEIEKGSQFKKLQKLKEDITYIKHKKKLKSLNKRIKRFSDNNRRAQVLRDIKWRGVKRKITDSEKYLSNKYFSADYVEMFNTEVIALNGKTQIDVDSRGSAGSSNRQLIIKGNNPSTILSESEQKVVAICDFLVEMGLSEINKGLIFDDPSTTLDDYRKSELAKRLVQEATRKQVIIFTHDLAFLSSIIDYCRDFGIENPLCNWIESGDDRTGIVYIDNTPSFEKLFKRSGKAQDWCNKAKKQGPEERENSLRSGFASLRTSYEALVVWDLFGGVIQRFAERVSVDSLNSVNYNDDIKELVMDGFYNCCRHMEGHSHSDKYASAKPSPENLQEEIDRFNDIKKQIKDIAKEKGIK